MRGIRILETRNARSLREDQPQAEALLWRSLRSRRLAGYKFVRQLPIGPYFADFACREAKLVVEVDGATHSTDAERRSDARRANVLHQHGYRIVRFNNDEIYRNLDGVLQTILAQLEKSDASKNGDKIPSPRLRGEG
jgi:very-short-patch-repair endonuclease